MVAEDIGFKTRNGKEYRYLILYVVVRMIIANLDMNTTYFLSMNILGGLGLPNIRKYENPRSSKLQREI